MKRKPPSYNAVQFDDLRSQLLTHRGRLAGLVQAIATGSFPDPDFESACRLRDAAQQLATTCLYLEQIGTVRELAALKGEAGMCFDLEVIGLEAK